MYQKTKYIFKVKILLILLVHFLFIPLHSQNYNLKTYTTEAGLPHNNVKSIVKDNAGFLWIATWDGLSRFDGYEFKNYFYLPDDSTSLPFFSLHKLCADKENNVWLLGNNGNLSLYNRKEDNFILYNDRIDSLLTDRFICDIVLDNSENLWLISIKGEIFSYDYILKKFKHIVVTGAYNKSLTEEIAPSISFDNKDNIWIMENRASLSSPVYKCQPNNKSEYAKSITVKARYQLMKNASFSDLPYNFIESFKFNQTSDGRIWLFSNSGLFSLDTSDLIFKDKIMENPPKEFSSGNQFIWFKLKDSAFFFIPGIKKPVKISSESYENIEAVYLDNFNTLWLGSMTGSGGGQGLIRCTISSTFFKNYPIKPYKSNELVAVFSILKDKYDNTWIGSRNLDYLFCVKPNGEMQKVYYNVKDIWAKNNHPRSMVEDSNGIWIGFYDKFLIRYNFINRKFSKIYPRGDLKSHAILPEYFRKIVLGQNGNLLVGSTSLYEINLKDFNLKMLWGPGNNTLYGIFKDQNKGYWIGDSRLVHLDSLFREVQVVYIGNSNYSIQDILIGGDNEVWLALLGGGICRYDIKTEIKKFYTTGNGLSNNTAYRILKDSKENLWISTNSGISMFNPARNQFRAFGEEDGLKILEFNSGAAFKSSDGELFFGGMGGFVRFYPDSLEMYEQIYPESKILLVDLKVSGERKNLFKPLNESDSIFLDKGENNFSLTSSSTDFTNSEKIRYRYRMSTINKNWIETDYRNRNINYSNLTPGWYDLSIEATEKDGNWNASRTLIIRIRPFFYQTKLFIITMPLLALALITSIIIIYIRQLKQKEQQKQDKLRLQSLRGLMNPHFIFNSLNSINYFISNNDKLSANRYIADFARLIRSILSNMGSDYVPFNLELDSIMDYLNIEHLRFGDKFDFEIKINEISEPESIEIFPGLIQPFIENAIWHGVRALDNRKGEISIRFISEGNDKIKCTIKDDGIGRKAANERNLNWNNHKSRGIEIVKERLEIISKLRRKSYILKINDLYNDRPDTGTIIELDIPCRFLKTQKL